MFRRNSIILTIVSLAVLFTLFIGCSQTMQVTVDDLLQNPDKYIGKRVEVTGYVQHVCHETGKRMFIKQNEEAQKTFKIVSTAKIEEFDIAFEEKTVTVAGLIKEQKVDKEFLDNWEKEIIGDEKPEVGHQGHEHDQDKVDTHHEPALEQINVLREKLANSEKEYLSFFSLACTTFEIVE